MRDHVLTLNAGSSSIKYALFAPGGAKRLAGQAEGLGAEGTAHAQALREILAKLAREAGDARIGAVGHRIVHGGADFEAPVVLDERAIAALEALQPLAPLHQPHNVAGVRAASAAFPGVPQVACFDTAFHRAQPPLNQRFALPGALHDEGIRRYGFHGLSFESIAGQLAQRRLGGSRVIVAHLGNGASLCAMRDGRSVATTMAFSPLEGLPMGTRCGRLDPGVVLYLMAQRGMDSAALARLLYRESGLLGLSGVSGDLRTLEASNEPAAAEAIDYFVEHVKRELAAMAAALEGVDTLVFTGGIGENAWRVRGRIVEGCAWMGAALDGEANRSLAERISTAQSRVAVLMLRTDEESVIARHAERLASAPRAAR